VDLEFHQLDLRYEALRTRDARRERQLLASLSERSQQVPVVVVVASSCSPGPGAPGAAGAAAVPTPYVLLDGYKRVRALRRLHVDTVRATCWALSEMEALLLERQMRTGGGDSALEQGWLLREVRDRFGLCAKELCRRFDKTPSWVSRRLGLVSELPESIQQRVRSGELAPYVAMKYLLPLARANRQVAEQVAQGLPAQVSIRAAGALYAAYVGGDPATRARILSDPALFVDAYKEAQRASPVSDKDPAQRLRADLLALFGIARRIQKRGVPGPRAALRTPEHDELCRLYRQAVLEVGRLGPLFEQKVTSHARSDDAHGDPTAA
jgi:ParB-like chromosome segregation protein Spo0J